MDRNRTSINDVSVEDFMTAAGVTVSVERVGVNIFEQEDHVLQLGHEHFMVVIEKDRRNIIFCLSYEPHPVPPEPGLALNHIADYLLLVAESTCDLDWIARAVEAGFDAFGHEEILQAMYERWFDYDLKMSRLLGEWYFFLLYQVKYDKG